MRCEPASLRISWRCAPGDGAPAEQRPSTVVVVVDAIGPYAQADAKHHGRDAIRAHVAADDG